MHRKYRKLVSAGLVLTMAGAMMLQGCGQKKETGKTEIERQLKRYKKAYEDAVTGKTIKNMVITVLLIIILGMLLVTFKTRYSVFTYFTNYKEEMREELVDEYEQWQDQLEQKEKQLDERENALKNK